MDMARYCKRILVGNGAVCELAEKYGVTTRTVYAALRFSTMNGRSEAIRKTAMEKYNGVMNKRPC